MISRAMSATTVASALCGNMHGQNGACRGKPVKAHARVRLAQSARVSTPAANKQQRLCSRFGWVPRRGHYLQPLGAENTDKQSMGLSDVRREVSELTEELSHLEELTELTIPELTGLTELTEATQKVKAIAKEREATRLRLRQLERDYAQARRECLNETEGCAISDEVNFAYTKENAGAYYDVVEHGVPGNILQMSYNNLKRESLAIINSVFPRHFPLPGSDELLRKLELTKETRAKLNRLELSNDAIWDREKKRHEEGGEVYAPWLIKVPYYLLCYMLDGIFDGRPIPRFWFLETVARTPYFSYSTMLYIYEVLGWWRRSSELRKVHFAEEWNEYHHLLIMESMGGDRVWIDRFFAQHSAVAYYFALVILWLISPTLAYNFSELIEAHAVDTYLQFVEQNEALLKTIPAPRVAREYYEGDDMYLFDEFMTEREPGSRRVKVETLYDVFQTIAEDEGEHVKTMAACQDEKTPFKNPAFINAFTALFASAAVINASSSQIMEAIEPILDSGAFADIADAAMELGEFLNVELIVDSILSLLMF